MKTMNKGVAGEQSCSRDFVARVGLFQSGADSSLYTVMGSSYSISVI